MTLISAGELSALIDHRDHRDSIHDGPVAICDVRFALTDPAQGRREYDAGHLPAARFVDLHTELAGGPGGGRHPLPAVGEFAALLGRLGITPATLVVAYDGAGGATAARLWWMLRSIGHGQAAVLDGGIQAWTAHGGPLTTDVDEVEPTNYRLAADADWSGIVSADDVTEALALGATVIDARAPERYRGDVEPIDIRAGHIPGAINRFHGDSLDADGRHRPLAELTERFSGLGTSPIVYCGSGVTACHAMLAMSEAGINQARLYPGSWSEWSSDPDRPIAIGDTTGEMP
jgi:thiosulfate/3-mercaptopyruvate sulfurtransferase